MGAIFTMCPGGLYPNSKPIPDDVTPSEPRALSAAMKRSLLQEVTPKCCFGAGCYWGTEKYFKHEFAETNVVEGRIKEGMVGFMGPKSAKINPTYEDVCSGVSGHVEVFNCEFAGGAPFYEAMVRFFFQFHDPTTMNKQGNDSGPQYASVIYCYDEAQLQIATEVKAELQSYLTLNQITCFNTKVVSTEIRMVEADFYPAMGGHQDYLKKNPNVTESIPFHSCLNED